MNQGNANPGPFAKDNGVFQDGGLILQFGSRYVGLFLRFATQWLPTDNTTGHRRPEAEPIPPGGSPAGGGGGGGPTRVTHPIVYIERALVNPVGDDAGKEVVVIDSGVACTVRVVLPVTVPNIAEMVVLPAFTAVATPLLLIVATLVLEDVHATWLVRFWVLPFE